PSASCWPKRTARTVTAKRTPRRAAPRTPRRPTRNWHEGAGMTDRDLPDASLESAARIDPPPPAPDLLKKVGAMKPVRTRSRFGAFLVVLAVGLLWPVVTLVRSPLRPDLGALPSAFVLGGAGVWGLALLASLAAALVPRRGDVLPSAPRASRVGTAAMLAVLLFSALATVAIPGVSLGLADV